MSRITQHPLSIPAVTLRSDRARLVAQWFGIDPNDSPQTHLAPQEDFLRSILPAPGEITLITGPSGAGKSSLLRRTRDLAPTIESTVCVDLATETLPNLPAVDCFGCDVSLSDALKLLCRAGLGEAWSYLRTPDELSEGQRWRLRLAVAIERARRDPANRNTILICDEFAAVLDRITACIIARMLRRAISRDRRISAIVATSHDDLIAALRPDILVTCDFSSAQVARRMNRRGVNRQAINRRAVNRQVGASPSATAR